MNQIKGKNYSVYFEKNGYDKLDEIVKQNSYSSIYVLVDSNTNKECIPIFKKRISNSFSFIVIEIDEGEENKNINSCQKVWTILSDKGGDRKSLVINLGGGVITDIGGFIASTFKRGIDFINIPTTLLSMVDASIGGKTGIDFGNLKNQIGVINDPKLVVIDPFFLNTLSIKELRNGYSEMLKHGLITDKKYWDKVSTILLEKKEPGIDEIFTSIKIKNKIVLDDPFEKNKRKVLNFGHTVGHAIESFFMNSQTHNKLSHGKSIAIGMIIEAYISCDLCKFKISEAKEIKNVFNSIFEIVNLTENDCDQIISLLKHDKKNSHGKTNFVLIESIGNALIDIQVPVKNIKKGFEFYLS